MEDVDKALKGMLEPTFREVVTAHAEVRQVFRVARKNSIAGCYVRDGTITRTDTARVTRNAAVIAEGKIATLKRFQEDVREVQTNFECGIQVEGFDSFEEGDVARVPPHRARDLTPGPFPEREGGEGLSARGLMERRGLGTSDDGVVPADDANESGASASLCG